MYQDLTTTQFDSKQAAQYLGFSLSTLNNARYTGLLGGVRAPKFKKLGKSIRYERASLDAWLAQFQEQTSTSESPNNAA